MSRNSSNSDGSPCQAIHIIHRVLHSKTKIIPLFPRTCEGRLGVHPNKQGCPLVPDFALVAKSTGVGQSRSCPQGAPSQRDRQGPHQAAVTTAGCEALRGIGARKLARARSGQRAGAGTGLHKSTRHSGRRHSVRSWGKFETKAPKRPGSRLTARGAA